jgi:hypothetical protein
MASCSPPKLLRPSLRDSAFIGVVPGEGAGGPFGQ